MIIRQKQPVAAEARTGEHHPCRQLDPCHHFCVPQEEAPYYRCLCRTGFHQSDGRTGRCSLTHPAAAQELILFGQGRPGMVRGVAIHLRTNMTEAEELMVPVARLGRPTPLDFHFARQHVYFADSTTNRIQRSAVLVEEAMVEDFLTEGLTKVGGLAVDWLANNLYWSDEGVQVSWSLITAVTQLLDPPCPAPLFPETVKAAQAILVCPLASPALRHTLPLGTLSRPRALALHPSKVPLLPPPPSPPPPGPPAVGLLGAGGGGGGGGGGECGVHHGGGEAAGGGGTLLAQWALPGYDQVTRGGWSAGVLLL